MKFRLGSAKPKFPWSMWYWTTATENLFDMTPEDRFVFGLLVDEANKTPTKKVEPKPEPKRIVAVVRKPDDYSYLDHTY